MECLFLSEDQAKSFPKEWFHNLSIGQLRTIGDTVIVRLTNGYNCNDCNVDTRRIHEYYMLKNHIWRKCCPNDLHVMLCIECCEKRLGRRLVKDDFMKTDTITQSERLKSRMQ